MPSFPTGATPAICPRCIENEVKAYSMLEEYFASELRAQAPRTKHLEKQLKLAREMKLEAKRQSS